jgi:hypothetical protein
MLHCASRVSRHVTNGEPSDLESCDLALPLCHEQFARWHVTNFWLYEVGCMLGPRSFTTKCCMEAECLPSVLLGIRGCQVYQCPICGTSHDKTYGQALS